MLTQRQEYILQIITDFIKINGYSPSIREICQISGLKSTSTVHIHLKNLCEEGYISYIKDKKRSIKLCNNTSYETIPVIGIISAGSPLFATENIESYLPVSNDLVRGRELFALKISGDSMINAGIYNNDLVIISRQKHADNGDIVAAMIDDSATVKRFYKENSLFRLQPENDDYEPIVCSEVSILGKVIGVYRTIE